MSAEVANQAPTIFLSHKHEDGMLARFVATNLTTLGSKVFISEDIPGGQAWHPWILQRLKQSSLLLLLYTDTTSAWDWCLYEVGVFTSLKKPRPIIYVYAGDRPRQLEHLQGYLATKDRLEAFLREYVTKSDAAQTEHVATFAQEWASRMRKRVATPLLPHFDVDVDASWHAGDSVTGTPEDQNLPDDTAIHGSFETQAVFGVGQPPWTLRQIVDARGAHRNQSWSMELARILQDAARRRISHETAAVYRGENRSFRTVPLRVEQQANGITRFSLLLLHEPTWEHDRLRHAISSFGDLMRELTLLVDSTTKDDVIGWLAYTPALGFLARPTVEWQRLYGAVCNKIDQIRFTCLEDGDLIKWHRKFIGLEREDGNGEKVVVTANTVDEATDISKQLVRRSRRPDRHLPFASFPGFYLFNNSHRAIVVTHFAMPVLEPYGDAEQDDPSQPEMFGAVTNDPTIVSRVLRARENYRPPARAANAGT